MSFVIFKTRLVLTNEISKEFVGFGLKMMFSLELEWFVQEKDGEGVD